MSKGLYDPAMDMVRVDIANMVNQAAGATIRSLLRIRLVKCYRLAMARDAGIYVEILIASDVDEIWRHTQVPELHDLWDLRFTGIQYLPRQSEIEAQRFLYSTRIGF